MERRPGTPEDSRDLVRTLACVLQKLVDVNRKLDSPGAQVITKFHASQSPGISISDYLERINKYASCSTECLVLALIYVDRLIQQSNFALTSLNVHRVIITSVMLAAKFFDDQYFNNKYYAKVGGVPCKEINSLEVEFLFLVNFSLHVTEEVYYRYFSELMNHAANSACPCCAGGRVARIVSSPAYPLPRYGEHGHPASPVGVVRGGVNSASNGPVVASSMVTQPPQAPQQAQQAGGGMFSSYFSAPMSFESAGAVSVASTNTAAASASVVVGAGLEVHVPVPHRPVYVAPSQVPLVAHNAPAQLVSHQAAPLPRAGMLDASTTTAAPPLPLPPHSHTNNVQVQAHGHGPYWDRAPGPLAYPHGMYAPEVEVMAKAGYHEHMSAGPASFAHVQHHRMTAAGPTYGSCYGVQVLMHT